MAKKDKISNGKPSFWSKVDYLVPLFAILAFINPLRAAFSQYYLLAYQDDIMWVSWISKNIDSPISLLSHGPGNGYRPTMNLLYALGYSIWGANEVGYYLLNGLLFAGTIVFLYLLIKLISDRLSASIAVLLFMFLDASFILVWKFNYIASISELFFITSALYFSFKFFYKSEIKDAYFAITLSILAFFAKEPSIVIIPAANIMFLLFKWNDIGLSTNTKRVSIAANLILPALSLIAVMYGGEFSSSTSGSMIEVAGSRAIFYLENELSWQLMNPYLFFIVCVGSLYLHDFKETTYNGISLNSIRNVSCIILFMGTIVAFNLWNLYSLLGVILVLLLLVLAFYFSDFNQRLGIVMFCVAIVPLLITSLPVQPTYLAEPNIGMCLFIGVTMSRLLRNIFTSSSLTAYKGQSKAGLERKIDKNTRIFFSILVIFVVLFQFAVFPQHIQSTNNYQKVVADRQASFKESVNYVISAVPEDGTIYYIPGEKRADIGRQISAADFYDLLCLKGRCDIMIESLDSFDEKRSSLNNPQFIVLLSNLDVYVFSNTYPDLLKTDMYSSIETFDNGDATAIVLKYG